MKNAINWFSIPVKEFERAKSFYEEVLGTSLNEVPMGPSRMAFFPTENGGVGGSLNEKAEDFAPLNNEHISIYLTAPDLEGSLSRTEGAGGKMIMGKTQITPEFGSFGVIMDTEGNLVGLHTY